MSRVWLQMAEVDWFPKVQSKPLGVRVIKGSSTQGIDSEFLTLEGKTSKLIKQLRPGQRLEQLYEQIHGKGRKAYFAFSRTHPDYPARTIAKDSAGLFHYSEDRTLTIGEYKRIGSFPDRFRLLCSTFSLALHSIGNSVPPLMMRVIAARIGFLFFRLDEMKPTTKVDYPAILEEAWQQHLASKADDAPTVVSLFAGCGGSSLGYSMAGYRELLAVEWNDNAVATFELNFPDVPVYHDDIHKLTVDKCLELADIEVGELDLLDGSPPCQGFSTADKRIMADKRNQLYMQFVRLLRGLQPKVFVMENVSGLVKGKMKLIFADIMRELKASGYDVHCKLLNAMYFNVPQSRQRLIWIGVRQDLKKNVSFPKAQGKPITARNATVNCQECQKPPQWRKFNLSLWQQQRPGQNGINGRHFSHCRIHPDRPSPTISKSCVFGGFSGLYHWIEPRSLNLGELMRLHSFFHNFNLIGTYEDGVNCIGNSVPPLFMRAIANHIRCEIL